MHFILKILVYLNLCAGVRCIQTLSLPCKFSDQQSFLNKEGHPEVNVTHRHVLLQFPQKGNPPSNPQTVTFLVTGSKLDLRQHLEGADAEQLDCELHRYSTDGSHIHWPVQETQGYNYWFSCIIRHSGGRFTISSFLRQPSDQPAPGRHDFHSWPAIKNGDVVTTSVAMIMKTRSPVVKAPLGGKKTLHCQFMFDHQPSDYTVEWNSRCEGRRTRLFTYSSLSRQTEGSGVELGALSTGDASFTVTPSMKCNVGTFICSVSVQPLSSSLDISWTVEERPQVVLSVGSVLSVEVGHRQRVYCKARGYYPREAEVTWYQYNPSVMKQGEPEVLNKTHSSHQENQNGTHTRSAFFDFWASSEDTGKHYICKVSHQSLNVPLTMSFILHVEDPVRKMFYFSIVLTGVSLSALLCLFYRMCSGRRRFWQWLPY